MRPRARARGPPGPQNALGDSVGGARGAALAEEEEVCRDRDHGDAHAEARAQRDGEGAVGGGGGGDNAVRALDEERLRGTGGLS